MLTAKARDIDELGDALGMTLASLLRLEPQTKELQEAEVALWVFMTKLAVYWSVLVEAEEKVIKGDA